MTKEQFNYILDRIDQTISQDPFLNNTMRCYVRLPIVFIGLLHRMIF